ncbi:hypothetical protein KBK19_04570 [Microvirga sp. STR05]|uniref:YubB ferredoxin-like domain-containing protein n=1 Tax=Hymenobacter duratus TaxID=2771356 RepID=A0ABR8JFY7_9BACT|nr:hypothetical protein [Hymenobacter duratus]MBD2714302.1 hypothetical protein [Hymenobacter duratus]MBR7949205.1 hypothetical protein [Microvirga sp. STR05]
MEDRHQYLTAMLSRQSVIEQAIQDDTVLADLTLDQSKALALAERLTVIKSGSAMSRASFIWQQIQGRATKEWFEEWCDIWGIPAFQEQLVDVSDFRNGFMWRFRDHTTSWSENQYALEWFLTSIEAQTVTRYELWSCDNGLNECIEEITGNYKYILQALLEAGVYEVLISPIFTSEELTSFVEEFDEDEHDFELEEILEDYISRNPNFVAE